MYIYKSLRRRLPCQSFSQFGRERTEERMKRQYKRHGMMNGLFVLVAAILAASAGAEGGNSGTGNLAYASSSANAYAGAAASSSAISWSNAFAASPAGFSASNLEGHKGIRSYDGSAAYAGYNGAGGGGDSGLAIAPASAAGRPNYGTPEGQGPPGKKCAKCKWEDDDYWEKEELEEPEEERDWEECGEDHDDGQYQHPEGSHRQAKKTGPEKVARLPSGNEPPIQAGAPANFYPGPRNHPSSASTPPQSYPYPTGKGRGAPYQPADELAPLPAVYNSSPPPSRAAAARPKPPASWNPLGLQPVSNPGGSTSHRSPAYPSNQQQGKTKAPEQRPNRWSTGTTPATPLASPPVSPGIGSQTTEQRAFDRPTGTGLIAPSSSNPRGTISTAVNSFVTTPPPPPRPSWKKPVANGGACSNGAQGPACSGGTVVGGGAAAPGYQGPPAILKQLGPPTSTSAGSPDPSEYKAPLGGNPGLCSNGGSGDCATANTSPYRGPIQGNPGLCSNGQTGDCAPGNGLVAPGGEGQWTKPTYAGGTPPGWPSGPGSEPSSFYPATPTATAYYPHSQPTHHPRNHNGQPAVIGGPMYYNPSWTNNNPYNAGEEADRTSPGTYGPTTSNVKDECNGRGGACAADGCASLDGSAGCEKTRGTAKDVAKAINPPGSNYGGPHPGTLALLGKSHLPARGRATSSCSRGRCPDGEAEAVACPYPGQCAKTSASLPHYPYVGIEKNRAGASSVSAQGPGYNSNAANPFLNGKFSPPAPAGPGGAVGTGSFSGSSPDRAIGKGNPFLESSLSVTNISNKPTIGQGNPFFHMGSRGAGVGDSGNGNRPAPHGGGGNSFGQTGDHRPSNLGGAFGGNLPVGSSGPGLGYGNSVVGSTGFGASNAFAGAFSSAHASSSSGAGANGAAFGGPGAGAFDQRDYGQRNNGDWPGLQKGGVGGPAPKTLPTYDPSATSGASAYASASASSWAGAAHY